MPFLSKKVLWLSLTQAPVLPQHAPCWKGESGWIAGDMLTEMWPSLCPVVASQSLILHDLHLLPVAILSLPEKHWFFLSLAGEQSKEQVMKNILLRPCCRLRFEAFLARQDFGSVLAALKPHCGNFLGSLNHAWDLFEPRFLQ